MRPHAPGAVVVLLLVLVLISLSPTLVVLAPFAFLAAIKPARGKLWRAALVLPFSGVLAATAWWSRGAETALLLLAKSYLSVLAVLTFGEMIPAPVWIATLIALPRVPVYFAVTVRHVDWITTEAAASVPSVTRTP